MKLDARVRERLAALIEKGEGVRVALELGRDAYGEYTGWRTQAIVCLTQVFGSTHTYTESFQSATAGRVYPSRADAGLGILHAALEDMEQGHLDTLQQLAAAEVFARFLDQADHLLRHDYVAPAASLAGAVLENGLRSLAERNDITVKPRDNLSALNSKIGGKGVYNRLRQKQVSVWIEVRDNADHGHFDKLTETDVADLIRGVQNFLAEQA